ncbi:MAG: ABC transporter permease [Armatimonadetes bacterium]|nr:ABC transporter permease [Armatimonadota bacterium]
MKNLPRAAHPPEVRVYTPDQQIGWGPAAWRAMAGELWRARELTWRLFLRDFNARYRQSVLGVAWAVVLPVATVATFVFLNRSGVLNIGDTGVPYPAYALLSLAVWQVFASGIGLCSNAIVAGGGMVVKINFPKETLVLAHLGQVLFDTAVRLATVALVFVLFRVAPRWTAVFLPLVLVPMVLLTLGLGLALAWFNALVRDVGHVLTPVTTFLLFMTPVLYPNTNKGLLAVVTPYNPLAVLVSAGRDVVITGHLTDPGSFAAVAALSVVVFVISWRVFHLVEPRLAERL